MASALSRLHGKMRAFCVPVQATGAGSDTGGGGERSKAECQRLHFQRNTSPFHADSLLGVTRKNKQNDPLPGAKVIWQWICT